MHSYFNIVYGARVAGGHAIPEGRQHLGARDSLLTADAVCARGIVE